MGSTLCNINVNCNGAVSTIKVFDEILFQEVTMEVLLFRNSENTQELSTSSKGTVTQSESTSFSRDQRSSSPSSRSETSQPSSTPCTVNTSRRSSSHQCGTTSHPSIPRIACGTLQLEECPSGISASCTTCQLGSKTGAHR